MSARRVWIAQCGVCETTKEYDGSMTEIELGAAARADGWDLPVYGEMFCPRCFKAVQTLSERMS